MGVWKFDRFSLLVAFFSSFSLYLLFYVFSWCFSLGFFGLYYCFDSVGLYLVFLTFVILVSVLFLKPWFGAGSFYVLVVSQIFSIFCYLCCHALFFWIFYEMSLVPLLYLLIKDSPYSERYTAFWYFLGYIVFCSLPMFLVVLFFSKGFGGFSLVNWCVDEEENGILFFLGLLFVTKIPLFPFHTWLPIVHAEASSVVSVCLSGYIMKLGLLGVFRFCYFIIDDVLFLVEYVGFIVLLSSFFVLCSGFELDCKRWLAFLSLAHIVVVPLCLNVGEFVDYSIGFCYCLGHGLSSSFAFILFWFMSEVVGSRNWFFLKSCVVDSFVFQVMVVSCFCLCGSFPFCLQFFCELGVICFSGFFSGLLFYSFCVYLFFSGLVPLVCLGFLLVRRQSVSVSVSFEAGPLLVLFFLFLLNLCSFLFF
uniref:NADH-ubiquinone oxidoreductase chain 4 n=1 Tax=Prosthogonimus cuneatus TaxID=232414 RepID=A0A7L7S0I1_9TREM|nr:NADH dehydrogenase subunit 4 [Prosthogonimus cuneatus]QNU39791.1 NADH dehydrogenase subunit 4 [Prosthogonimus cuneatus]